MKYTVNTHTKEITLNSSFTYEEFKAVADKFPEHTFNVPEPVTYYTQYPITYQDYTKTISHPFTTT